MRYEGSVRVKEAIALLNTDKRLQCFKDKISNGTDSLTESYLKGRLEELENTRETLVWFADELDKILDKHKIVLVSDKMYDA